jgi:hypothetical protein
MEGDGAAWRVLLLRLVALQIATSTSLRCDTFRCARGGRVGVWCDASLTHYIVTCHLSSSCSGMHAREHVTPPTPPSQFSRDHAASAASLSRQTAVQAAQLTSKTQWLRAPSSHTPSALQKLAAHTSMGGESSMQAACACVQSAIINVMQWCAGDTRMGPAGEEQRIFASN